MKHRIYIHQGDMTSGLVKQRYEEYVQLAVRSAQHLKGGIFLKRIRITSKGIEKTLRKFNYLQAISEYIWNGFDACATVVDVQLQRNPLGGIDQITIADNGYGIDRDALERKFTPFYESEKQVDPGKRVRVTSAMHGKNGIGRLTFHRFASDALWRTTYEDGASYMTYTIHVRSDRMDSYEATGAVQANDVQGTGTTVTFHNIIKDFVYEELIAYLCREFGWFLELNSDKGFDLKVDGSPLDYSSLIREKEWREFVHKPTQTVFHLKYIQWNDRINHEHSKIYFIDSTLTEKHKQPTTFNNKSDSFYHSVYIQSSFFDHFDFDTEPDSEQLEFGFGANKRSEEYLFMIDEVSALIKQKRKPYLKTYSDVVIQDFAEADAFPPFLDIPEDRLKKEELESVIREMYQAAPKIFTDLNREQKKIVVHLIHMALGSNDRQQLLNIFNI
ncbi:ATP-binding protein [Paenibacillus sp. UNC451MF]|uniref:ATP-binding protein n=1 Tax=Paenibacillus sp. UNC451MF TaxID=1449063 RepID=UPI00048BF6BB|nr:ATP-binding protein [Paenibacillus sp. UNC451MF]